MTLRALALDAKKKPPPALRVGRRERGDCGSVVRCVVPEVRVRRE